MSHTPEGRYNAIATQKKEKLKDIIEKNNNEELRKWFETNSYEENYICDDVENRNALQIACFRITSKDCIETILNYVGVNDLLHKDNYNKTALNYALQNGNIEIIKIVLHHYIEKNIDVSDILYKLIYHIYDADKSEANYIETINFILSNNIDVNYIDGTGWTCIYMAAKNKFKSIVGTLINSKFDVIDLDTFEELNARQLITTSNLYDGNLPDPISTENITINTLYQILFRCSLPNETNALQKETLQEDFKKSYLQIKSTLNIHQEKELFGRSIKYNTTESAKLLLSNIRFDPSDFIVKATENGCTQIVKEILSKFEVKKELISKSIIQILKEDFSSKKADYKNCLEELLNAKNLDINLSDKENVTPLHYAARYHNRDIIMEILKADASLAVEDFNKSVVAEVDPSVLKEYWNYCISLTNKNYINNSRTPLTINLTSLLPPRKQKDKFEPETQVLQEMTKSKELRKLLVHPIILLFISLKWQSIPYVSRIPFFISLIHTIIVIMYIECKTTFPILWYTLLGFILVIDIFLISFQIFIHILPKNIHIEWTPSNLRTYLKNCFNNFTDNFIEYLLQIVLIIATIGILASYNNEKCNTQYSAIAILVSTILLFLHCGQFSYTSVYVMMLRTVTLAFLKLFLWYSILILGFAYSFYVVLISENETKMFENVGESIFKTIIMFTGEFDASNIEFDTFPSYFIFILFVFLITIVLSNLSSALAVSDVQEIRNEAEINEQVFRINQIAHFEKMLFSELLVRKVPTIKQICLFPQSKDAAFSMDAAKRIDIKIISDNNYSIEGLKSEKFKVENKIQDAIQKTRREIKAEKELRDLEIENIKKIITNILRQLNL